MQAHALYLIDYIVVKIVTCTRAFNFLHKSRVLVYYRNFAQRRLTYLVSWQLYIIFNESELLIVEEYIKKQIK
jgi:hypothetical protein